MFDGTHELEEGMRSADFSLRVNFLSDAMRVSGGNDA
jgi:hypothetical protein